MKKFSEFDLDDLVEYSTATKKALFSAHSAHAKTGGEGSDYASHLDKAEKSHGKDSKSGAHKGFDSLHPKAQKSLKGALKSHAAGGKHMEHDDHHVKTLGHMDKALKHGGGKKKKKAVDDMPIDKGGLTKTERKYRIAQKKEHEAKGIKYSHKNDYGEYIGHDGKVIPKSVIHSLEKSRTAKKN